MRAIQGETKKPVYIWIGNKLPGDLTYLLDIELLPFVSKGSCVISEDKDQVARLADAHGGTHLRFDFTEGFTFIDFKVHGSINANSYGPEGSYLGGVTNTAKGEVRRVTLGAGINQVYYSQRVIENDCAYMVTYGLKISEETMRLLKSINKDIFWVRRRLDD